MKTVIFLFLFSALAFGQAEPVKYIISNDSLNLVAVNQYLNQQMYLNIPNYSATQYSTIYKHKTAKLYALLIDLADLRNVYDKMNSEQKARLVSLPANWEWN